VANTVAVALLGDPVAVALLEHALVRRDVVPGHDHVPAVVGADVLVLVEGEQHDLRAALVGALAEERRPVVLVEVARGGGVPAHLIDDESEIDEAWLEGVEVVGVTSGASAPEKLVSGVCDWFRSRGVEIAAAPTVHEDVEFRLPVEVRPGATAA
jgi:hypothetical protein